MKKSEASSDEFIFLRFIQEKVTRDPEGEAPVGAVGAYNEENKLVLVLDPDHHWTSYWTFNTRKDAGWIYFHIRSKR